MSIIESVKELQNKAEEMIKLLRKEYKDCVVVCYEYEDDRCDVCEKIFEMLVKLIRGVAYLESSIEMLEMIKKRKSETKA